MLSIKGSVEINASPERVWSIIADVDRESEYWKGLNSARVTKREGNVIEREVEVGFMGHTGHQIVRLNPQSSTIDIEMTDGPLVGLRQMKLIPLQIRTMTSLEASWNFSFSKVPIFARGFVKSQIEKVTKDALEKIALEAEGKKLSNKVVLVSSSK
ncbi:MAG: SRPBCC family protein [Nitrososphaerota archaeon]|nr:SRPBCC family protein [Nitrososphaerota archaeon]